MNPLTSIPGPVRIWIYWIGYGLGVTSQGLTITWGAIAATSTDVSMPLWLVLLSAIIAFAQTQLNLLAGSNVVDTRTTTTTAPAEAEVTTRVTLPPNEDGRTDSTVLFYATSVPVALVIVAGLTIALIGWLLG